MDVLYEIGIVGFECLGDGVEDEIGMCLIVNGVECGDEIEGVFVVEVGGVVDFVVEIG